MKTKKEVIELIKQQLIWIGEDPEREGLKDTPERIIKMWEEVFCGYSNKNKPNLTTFLNSQDGIKYDEMIVDTGEFYSYCEHHIIPFFGNYWFAYIPNDKIIGISKIVRLINFHSKKLQIQERLVKDVLDDLEILLNPKGIALIMEGEHLCKTMRGARNKGKIITSDLRGVFKTNNSARTEFLMLRRSLTR